VAFTGYWLEAPRAVLAARLDARVGDASDADARVLEQQLQRDPGQIGWTRVDAAGAAAKA
jgi:predicted kinase